MSSAQLGQPVTLPIYNTRQHVTAADKPRRVSFDFLHGPTAAVIGSALLMLLIGWIDYKSTDFAITVFYFGPVVLATWRAGRKAGWFIAALGGATVLMADLMVPRSGRVIALSYINAGILVLASAALAELVIFTRHAHERLKALLALKTISLTEIHHKGEEQPANRIQLAPAAIWQVCRSRCSRGFRRMSRSNQRHGSSSRTALQ